MTPYLPHSICAARETRLVRFLTLVDSGNSPQDHCMCASPLSTLSEGFTTSSESLLGDMDSDLSLSEAERGCLFCSFFFNLFFFYSLGQVR